MIIVLTAKHLDVDRRASRKCTDCRHVDKFCIQWLWVDSKELIGGYVVPWAPMVDRYPTPRSKPNMSKMKNPEVWLKPHSAKIKQIIAQRVKVVLHLIR